MAQENVEKVFSRDKFSIPQYQRDYAWKRQNFIDLWEDLEEAIESKDSQGHFLGTIVVAPNNDNPQKFDIIDGQQRATTIFMLLYALIYKSEFKDNLKFKFLLDKRNKLKLEVAPQNQIFFAELLAQAEQEKENIQLKDKADTQGKKNLYEVFQTILDKVAKLNSSEVEKYIDSLKAMILMWLEEPNSGRAIRTFQSVNDRGVPLNLLDKLKSLLIYYSNRYCEGNKKKIKLNDDEQISLDEKINNDFGKIFKIFLKIEEHPYISNIGNQQFSEADIFRYHAGSKKFDGVEFLGHYRRSSQDTYTEIKNELKSLVKKQNYGDLEKFLVDYTSDLKSFYQAFLDMLNNTQNNAEIFKLILLGKINPYFYNSLLRLKIDNELDNEMIVMYAKADILFFKSGSSRDATAFNLIEAYIKNNSKDELRNRIVKECKKVDIERTIEKLIKYADEFGGTFHLVFFEQNANNVNIETLKSLIQKKELTQEIEHIMPLSILEKKDGVRAKQLGFDDLDDLDSHIRNYGNLLSLEKSLNGKAKDKDLLRKEEIYQDSKLQFIRQFDTKNFNKKALKARNDEFREWLKAEFFKDFL